MLDLEYAKLNGTQVLEMLKKANKLKDITVIIYSTSVNQIEKEQTLKLGAHSYVIKPSSYEECLEKARYFNSFLFSWPNSDNKIPVSKQSAFSTLSAAIHKHTMY